MPAFPSANMSNESNALVLDTEELGTRLSFALYEFSVNVSSAMGDINRLAKGINLLALSLRQAGDNLKKYGTLPSAEAWNTVRHVSLLCRVAFDEVGRMVPIQRLQDVRNTGGLGGDVALAKRLRNELDWNALAKSNAAFLMENLESLRLTLSVMSQTLYTANAIALSSREQTQAHNSLVHTQRLQMETLIIEQQLSLLRTFRLYDQFRYKVDNTPLAVTHNASPQSVELIRRGEGPNPGPLESYQEPSLLQIHQPQSDIDDLARVRSISNSFVDALLHRWTSLPKIVDGFRKIDLYGESMKGDVGRVEAPPTRDQANVGRLVRRDSNYKPAEAESDIDSEDENATRRPKLALSTAEPVLQEVDDSLPPVGLSAAIAATREQLLSPQQAQSWSAGAGTYFTSSHGHSRPRRSSQHVSPLSSPRASFSSINSPRASFSSIGSPRPGFSSMTGSVYGSPSGSPPSSISGSQPMRSVTAHRSDTTSFPPPPTQAVQPMPQLRERPPIPWRIRVNQEYWEYRDAVEVESNTRMDLSKAMKDFKAVTEIDSEYVTRDAVKERGLEFTRIRIPVDVPRGDGKTRTEMLSRLCIDKALSFNDIKALVKRTEELRAEDELEDQRRRDRRREDDGRRGGREQAPPRSPRTSITSHSGGPVRPPPLERSQTSPIVRIPPPAPHGYTSTYRYSPRTSPSNSTSSVPTNEPETPPLSQKNRHDSLPRNKETNETYTRPRQTDAENDAEDNPPHPRRSSSTHPRPSSRKRSDTTSASTTPTRSRSSRRNSSSHRPRDSSAASRKRERREGRAGSFRGKMVMRTAAGLGLATLVQGLPEMLEYL